MLPWSPGASSLALSGDLFAHFAPPLAPGSLPLGGVASGRAARRDGGPASPAPGSKAAPRVRASPSVVGSAPGDLAFPLGPLRAPCGGGRPCFPRGAAVLLPGVAGPPWLAPFGASGSCGSGTGGIGGFQPPFFGLRPRCLAARVLRPLAAAPSLLRYLALGSPLRPPAPPPPLGAPGSAELISGLSPPAVGGSPRGASRCLRPRLPIVAPGQASPPAASPGLTWGAADVCARA